MAKKKKQSKESERIFTNVEIVSTTFVTDTLGGHENLEYRITTSVCDEGVLYTMHREHELFQHVMNVLDDGNGVQFYPGLPKDADYTQIYEMFLMLQFIDKKQSVRSEFRFLEEI